MTIWDHVKIYVGFVAHINMVIIIQVIYVDHRRYHFNFLTMVIISCDELAKFDFIFIVVIRHHVT